tara:strand:+ start:315 stop:767 length:453 start_codon:yes stop_codon:yes gene_type:complete
MAFGPYNERLEGGERYLSMLEGGGNYLPSLEGGIEPGRTENMFSNMELRGNPFMQDPLNYIPSPMMEGVNRDFEYHKIGPHWQNWFRKQGHVNNLMGLLGYTAPAAIPDGMEGSSGGYIHPTFDYYNKPADEIGQSGTGDNPKPKDYPQY